MLPCLNYGKNNNMFNLNQAVAEWRRQMTDGGMKSSVALDELESHLREEVEHQMRSGVDTEKAFRYAVEQIGGASELAPEFEKVGTVGRSFERTATEVWGYLLVALNAALAAFALSHVELSPMEHRYGVMAVVLGVVFAMSGRLAQYVSPARAMRKSRVFLQLAWALPVAMAWLAFFCFVLPRLDLTMGRLVLVVIWSLVPLAAVYGISEGLEHSAIRKYGVGSC